MKKILFTILFLSTFVMSAQVNFGVKAGVNYGDNGDIEISDATSAGEDAYYGANSKIGYHFGVFLRTSLAGKIYLKPEILYTQTKSSYAFNDDEADYNVSKIDLPIMVGFNIIGPLNIFGGPSLQYITDHDLDGVSFGEIENEFTVGIQFGLGVQLGGIGIDARYESGLNENTAEVLDFDDALGGVRRIDARPNQFILSLSLDF